MEEGITNEKHYTYACKLRGALSPTLDFRAIYACSGPSPRPRSHAHHTNSGTPTGEHIHGKHPTALFDSIQETLLLVKRPNV